MIRKSEPTMQNAWDYGSEHGERLVPVPETAALKQALEKKTAELQQAWNDLHRERAQVGGLHAENVQLKNTIEAMADELSRREMHENAQAAVYHAMRERALELAIEAHRAMPTYPGALIDTAESFLRFLAGTVPDAQPEMGGSQLAETAPPNVEITTRDDDEIVFYPEPDGSKHGE